MSRLSRRRALSLAGLGAVGAAGAVGVTGSAVRSGAAANPDAAASVPFFGPHQAGIITPAQDRLHFVAFDVITNKRAALADMLREWTLAAARMTTGRDAGPA